MSANRSASAHTLTSDLQCVDAQEISEAEYDEPSELTDAKLERGTLERAGRPVAANPRRQVIEYLPAGAPTSGMNT